MICSRGTMEAGSLGSPTDAVKRCLLRGSRRVPRVLGVAVRVAEIKVPQIDGQRHGRAQHAHGIALVNRKITEHQQTAERAALPETERDHAFPRAFRGDPLDDETQAEHEAACEPDNFPWMNQNPEHVGLGEKLEAVHNAPRFLQGAAVYKPPSFFPNPLESS